MGAWIEIKNDEESPGRGNVAPCMGAWIEIKKSDHGRRKDRVAPCMGAWIEICAYRLSFPCSGRRTLYGCVDCNP